MKVCNDFESMFHGKQFEFHTAYKPLSCFKIKFDKKQLPHLLGLHKVYTSKSADDILNKIKTEDIDKNILKKHKDYGAIKDRIKCCDFLEHIIYSSDDQNVFYLSEIDKQNRMQLDIVFYETMTHKQYVLGLRNIKGDQYAPVTFYAIKSKQQQFLTSKKVKINRIIG